MTINAAVLRFDDEPERAWPWTAALAEVSQATVRRWRRALQAEVERRAAAGLTGYAAPGVEAIEIEEGERNGANEFAVCETQAAAALAKASARSPGGQSGNIKATDIKKACKAAKKKK